MPHVARDVASSEPFDECIACPYPVYWSPMLLLAAPLRPPGRNFTAVLGQPKEYAKCLLNSDRPSHDSPPNARATEPASLSGHTCPNLKLNRTRTTVVAPTAQTSCHTSVNDAAAGTCALANVTRLRRGAKRAGSNSTKRRNTPNAVPRFRVAGYVSIRAHSVMVGT